jgi:hypothetical protein
LPFPMHKVSAITWQLYEASFHWHTNMQLERMLVRKASPVVFWVPLRSNCALVDFSLILAFESIELHSIQYIAFVDMGPFPSSREIAMNVSLVAFAFLRYGH